MGDPGAGGDDGPDRESEFDRPALERLRTRTGVKWRRHGPEVIPAWVADMDFELAPPVRAALVEAVASGDLGYAGKLPDTGLPEAFAGFARRRFGWEVEPSRVGHFVDVVQGLYLTAELFAGPGEGILTTTPVYPPFLTAIADTGRRLVESTFEPRTLPEGGQRFELDLDHLARQAAAGARVLFLCNPHNPTGRCLSREELEAIAEMALRHDLVVLADEIHADLVYSGHRHIPFQTLAPEVAARTVTMTSATKSFNIAGLRFAIAVFGSEAIERRYRQVPERLLGGINTAGLIATRAAWEEGEPWLERLVAYLEGNRDFALGYLRRHLPAIAAARPEATFLLWLDARALELDPDPFTFFLERARVALGNGADFGTGGEGRVRLNFATPRAVLREILERMRRAVEQGAAAA